ncbi:transposase [Streptosporangium sandarakinum]
MRWGVPFEDADFAAAFSTRGRPAPSPARLALVSILQFGEGLSDRQAAEAVRARIDWKYALGLELTDAGFDHSVLSEFRDRLITGSLEQSLLDTILERAVTAGLLRAGGRQRTDSTHVLMAMRTMNRLEQMHETARAALSALAAAAPDWLLTQAEPGRFDRYEVRIEDFRLPKNKAERVQPGHEIGADGHGVLRAVYSETAPAWLRDIPAVQNLRHVWIQQYVTIDDHLRWRTPDEQPPDTIRQISDPRPACGPVRWQTGPLSLPLGKPAPVTSRCGAKTARQLSNGRYRGRRPAAYRAEHGADRQCGCDRREHRRAAGRPRAQRNPCRGHRGGP